MTQLDNDNFGRTVFFYTDGVSDTYTVSDALNNSFTLKFPAGWDRSSAYFSINSMPFEAGD